MPNITVPKGKRHLYTHEEVANMIDNAKMPHDKALIAFYYIFGIRRNEAFFIRKEDTTIEDGWFSVKIIREKFPEGSVLPRVDTLKVRIGTVFLDYILKYLDEVTEVKHAYLDKKRQKTDRKTGKKTTWTERINFDGKMVFYGQPNIASSSHAFYMRLKELNPNGWIHLFRHTRNDFFTKKGKRRDQRMAWFGWRDPRSADKTYTHPSEEDIEEMGRSIE